MRDERAGAWEAQEEGPVATRARKTAKLGDLIAAAFDEAARYSANPREVSRLATQAVRYLMRRASTTADASALCLGGHDGP